MPARRKAPKAKVPSFPHISTSASFNSFYANRYDIVLNVSETIFHFIAGFITPHAFEGKSSFVDGGDEGRMLRQDGEKSFGAGYGHRLHIAVEQRFDRRK